MLTAQLIGNLGHGAESKQISERHALTFSVAHKEGRDANTTWVKVVYFCRERKQGTGLQGTDTLQRRTRAAEEDRLQGRRNHDAGLL